MRGTLANSPQLSMISISLSAKVYQWISSFVRDMSLRDQCHSSLFSRKIGDLGKCEVIHLKKQRYATYDHSISLTIPMMNGDVRITKQSGNGISNQKDPYSVDINEIWDVGKQH